MGLAGWSARGEAGGASGVRRAGWGDHLVFRGVMKTNCRRCWRSDSSSRRSRQILRLCMSCKDRDVHVGPASTFFPGPPSPRRRAHHVDVKLIQTPEGRLGDLPQRQHEADGGEGALASGQQPQVAHAVPPPAGRLDLQVMTQSSSADPRGGGGAVGVDVPRWRASHCCGRSSWRRSSSS